MKIPLTAAGLVLLLACAGPAAPKASQPELLPKTTVGDEALFALGRETFQRMGCAGCHIREGVGSDKAPNLDMLAQKIDPTYVRESIVEPKAVIKHGFRDLEMPENFGSFLSEREIDALQYYLSNNP